VLLKLEVNFFKTQLGDYGNSQISSDFRTQEKMRLTDNEIQMEIQ